MSGSERQVVLLLEDSLQKGVAPHNHGPSLLIKSLLTDRLVEDGVFSYWDPNLLRDQLVIYPRKGDTKLRKDCCEPKRYERFSSQGQVVVMVDRDKLHRLVGLSFGACRVELREQFLEGCPQPDEVEFVLLEDNMETILRAVADLLEVSDDVRERAVKQKKLNERDALLIKLYDYGQGALRDRLLIAVPSLGRLIDKLAARLSMA